MNIRPYLQAALNTLVKSPHTSAMGLASIAGAVVSIVHDPSSVGTMQPWLLLCAGLHLLVAGDTATPAT